MYFISQPIASLQHVHTQWELGSDNHIGTVLRNGQTKYMAANTDVNVTDITVGCVWTYECISANIWR